MVREATSRSLLLARAHWRRRRRSVKGICWFKDTAAEHLARMHILKRIAEEHGHVVSVIREDRIGYIVFEDDNQVVAEPFWDTRTR